MSSEEDILFSYFLGKSLFTLKRLNSTVRDKDCVCRERERRREGVKERERKEKRKERVREGGREGERGERGSMVGCGILGVGSW